MSNISKQFGDKMGKDINAPDKTDLIHSVDSSQTKTTKGDVDLNRESDINKRGIDKNLNVDNSNVSLGSFMTEQESSKESGTAPKNFGNAEEVHGVGGLSQKGAGYMPSHNIKSDSALLQTSNIKPAVAGLRSKDDLQGNVAGAKDLESSYRDVNLKGLSNQQDSIKDKSDNTGQGLQSSGDRANLMESNLNNNESMSSQSSIPHTIGKQMESIDQNAKIGTSGEEFQGEHKGQLLGNDQGNYLRSNIPHGSST